MEDLLKAWEKEYRHFEKLKETEIRHIQYVKINARALQLKYCIKALKEQLNLSGIVKSFYCLNKDQRYKDSICVHQCPLCYKRDNNK